MRQEEEEKRMKEEEISRLEVLHKNLPKIQSRQKAIIPIRDVDRSTDKASKGYKGHYQVSNEEIEIFVNEKIENGPQIVNFAVGNYNHAIMVDVQDYKVMISDWNGDEIITSEEKRTNPDYRNYCELIEELKRKYDRPIEFYPVDLYVKKIADIKNKDKGNVGGCSEYLFSWLDVYYRTGHYVNPF